MFKLNLKSGLIAAAAVSVLLAGGVAAPTLAQPPVAKSFAHIGSDVPVDPAVTFGVLPNGMRYAIRRNSQPAAAVSMRFHIAAGSAHEAPDQLGLAHFLEHMAFNGSTNVPEDQVFKILQRLGAAPGADANAGTSPLQTVYMFNMPKNDDESVDTALMLFRETASELKIDPAAVDRERGVVLSEERGRASPSLRASAENSTALFGSHPMGRDPIGNTETLRTAPASRIKAFYDAYYRPERATLVIVGDIDPAAIEAKVKAKFSDWWGRGPAGKDLAPVDVAAFRQKTKLYTETGVAPGISLTWLSPPENRADTRANERLQTVDGLAMALLTQRFGEVASGPNPPFILGLGISGETRGVVGMTTIVTVGMSDLDGSVEPLVRIQRQATEFGFRQDELDRAITQTRTGLQAAVASASTRRTPPMVDALLGQIVNERSFRTPQQTLEGFEAMASNITLAEVNAALKKRFEGRGPLLFAMDAKPLEGGEAKLEQAFAAARAAPVTAAVRAAAKPWTYTNFGTPGAVVQRRGEADLGLTMLTFANGVRLTVKPTTFAKDQIQVSVMFGAGELDLPRDKVSPAQMLSGAYIAGGLGKMTAQERQVAFTGKSVGVGASVGEGGFLLTGASRPQDFELQMQLLAAYMTDPAWAPPGYDRERQFLITALATIDTQPAGVYSFNAPYLLHGKDSRWAPPTPDLVRSIDVAHIKAFMAPIIAEADMEVVIVGDITVDEAIAQTARTFGALPPRKPRVEPAGARDVKFPTGTPSPIIVTHKGRADQGIASIVWPVPGYWKEPELGAQLRILQIILADRVNQEMREKQGKSYGVSGDMLQSRIFDYGTLTLQTEISAADMPLLYQAVDTIVRDLQTTEVTQDELDRAVRPRREVLRRTFLTNAYWSTTLLGVQLAEARIEDIRRNPVIYDEVTPASIKAAAKAWLTPEKAWKMTVIPEAAAVAAK